MLAEYEANYNALVRHVPQPIGTPTRLFVACRSRGFPLLSRFNAPHGGDLELVAMDEDHFSIIRGEALRAIMATSLLRRAHNGRPDLACTAETTNEE